MTYYLVSPLILLSWGPERLCSWPESLGNSSGEAVVRGRGYMAWHLRSLAFALQPPAQVFIQRFRVSALLCNLSYKFPSLQQSWTLISVSFTQQEGNGVAETESPWITIGKMPSTKDKREREATSYILMFPFSQDVEVCPACFPMSKTFALYILFSFISVCDEGTSHWSHHSWGQESAFPHSGSDLG